MLTKNLWMGVNGVKTKGLHLWSWVSFKELHKLMVFTFDMAEEQLSYI